MELAQIVMDVLIMAVHVVRRASIRIVHSMRYYFR